MGLVSRFNRHRPDLASGPAPDPASNEAIGKLATEALKAGFIAIVVYGASVLARHPQVTTETLQEHDKRLALLEQSMSDIKSDLREIKRAVTKR